MIEIKEVKETEPVKDKIDYNTPHPTLNAKQVLDHKIGKYLSRRGVVNVMVAAIIITFIATLIVGLITKSLLVCALMFIPYFLFACLVFQYFHWYYQDLYEGCNDLTRNDKDVTSKDS